MQFFLVNVHEGFDVAWDFVVGADSEMTCLLDDDGSTYNSYAFDEAGTEWAPYPRQVVIDPEGLIAWFGTEVDAEALRAAIDAAMAR